MRQNKMSNCQPSPSRRHPHKAPRSPRSYTPLSDALSQPLAFADTELAEGLQRHSLVGLLRAAIGRKRRSDGEPLPNVLWALLVWPLLKVKSSTASALSCARFSPATSASSTIFWDARTSIGGG